MRNTSFAEQSTVWCGYVMDTWRVTRKLNVTLGIRYEVEGPLTERYNRSIRGLRSKCRDPASSRGQGRLCRQLGCDPNAGNDTGSVSK